jgi:hypothetical protein
MDLRAGPAHKWLRMSNAARSSGQTQWPRHTISEKSATGSVRLTPRAHPSALQNRDWARAAGKRTRAESAVVGPITLSFLFLIFLVFLLFYSLLFLFFNPNLNLKSVVNLSSFKCTTEYTS